MDAVKVRESDHAFGSTAVGLVMLIVRIIRTLVVTVLVSGGILLLATANFDDGRELVVIGVGVALLLVSVLMLPAGSQN